ncbi:LOW QUALITY PROTEIN: B-cell CLL/lymphoma 9-like protein [Erpetoichthys calabaricus]|uniref:LOW QUALITY PROTEIN: B-cell CLL/lymphoma 9-like protein n=1 Tax=Erpetoichthys calabaricus TaxID=27687 RepID=UPI0022344F5E|nr:LOW QUALITY PROTEIN: B-cell CLL/lymphoma 9-like protein [Erpetoichthys calabaricus]
MHPDNKLNNHGKQVSSSGQSQHQNVTQGPACSLGSKGIRSGGHGSSKVAQVSPGNAGLKSSGQSVSGVGALKGRAKRERSISVDSGDQREALASAGESELKVEGVMRRKRRCVLEKKQPYSGDEWCSGAESEEEEEKPLAAALRDPLVSVPPQAGPGANALSGLAESGSSTAELGTGLLSELGSATKPMQQIVYVFTTNLANSAAEAVIQGRADSIIAFHQQNVPRAKLEQHPFPISKAPNLQEQVSVGTPPGGTPKSQSATPQPASVGAAVQHNPLGTPLSAGPPGHYRGASQRDVPSICHRRWCQWPDCLLGERPAGKGRGSCRWACNVTSSPPRRLQPWFWKWHSAASRSRPGNAEGLSKEQLEHRERSLQTLRDIERLLLRNNMAAGTDMSNNTGAGGAEDLGQQDPPPPMHLGPPSNSSQPSNKKYEEPLQSMLSQTQNLGVCMDEGPMGPHIHPHCLPPHSSPSAMDMGLMMGPEGLTPEQIAWRKLQDEYYQEKRRKQELHVHPRMGAGGGPEMGLIMRGPPPPYHSKAGEPWPPGGPGSRFIEMQHEGSRGPRFHPGTQMSRMPVGPSGGFGGMPLETMGPIQRTPGRAGIPWIDDMPPMGGPPGSFPAYPGQHTGDPRVREEVFRIMEKRQLHGLQRHMGVTLEMERMAQQQQQVPVGSVGDPIDFPGSRAMLDSPMAHSGGPPMDISLSLLSQKIRGGGVGGPIGDIMSPEEITRRPPPQNGMGSMMAAAGPSSSNKMISGGSPFPNQGPFSGETGGYQPQDMGNPNVAQPQDLFASDQQGPPMPMSLTSRLSHMPMQSHGSRTGNFGGRRSSDLTITINQMDSPGMAHQLKSPPLNHTHSPMASPSTSGLKSPQLTSLGGGGPQNSGPPSASIKSPQVMGPSSLGVRSPSGSPNRLKSPSVPTPSPGWTSSPKTAVGSPGLTQANKSGGGPSGNTMDSGVLPPRSNNLISLSQPGAINPSMPFTSSPDAAPSQNPLSLIMSQMSKYAMPSSTPLYHDAIKTIATSDDELLPERPLLPGSASCFHSSHFLYFFFFSCQEETTCHLSCTYHPTLLLTSQSPMGMGHPGQPPLSHDPTGPMMPSPPMNLAPMNAMLMSAGAQEPAGPRNGSPMLSQGQIGGFPRLQPPQPGPMQSPGLGLAQPFHPGMSLPPPDDDLPPQAGQMPLLGKNLPHSRAPSDPYPPMPQGVASVLGDPDLSEVIRPTPSGIPEFDLSRIIPSEKPSSTLQYFPKSEPRQPHKPPQVPPSNPHLINLQNMMVEQQSLPPPSRPGLGLPVMQGQSPGPGAPRNMAGLPVCHPGHMMSRTGMPPPQQSMMGNNLHPHHGMMSPHQQSLLMMQAKQRSVSMSGDMYGPQGPLMGPPQPGMMRHRSVSLDGYGPGGMANLPF